MQWTPVPEHLYKFPLMLTSSSCVIFNQRKLLNALESLVALPYWSESNQAGGKRDRKRRLQAKQHNSLLKRGQERSRREKAPGYRMWEISVHPHKMKANSWVARLETSNCYCLQKRIFFLHGVLNSHPAVLQWTVLLALCTTYTARAKPPITYLKPARGEFWPLLPTEHPVTHNPWCTCPSNPGAGGSGSRGCTYCPYCGQSGQQGFHIAHTVTLSSCEVPQNSLYSHLKNTDYTVIIINVNAEL